MTQVVLQYFPGRRSHFDEVDGDVQAFAEYQATVRPGWRIYRGCEEAKNEWATPTTSLPNGSFTTLSNTVVVMERQNRGASEDCADTR